MLLDTIVTSSYAEFSLTTVGFMSFMARADSILQRYHDSAKAPVRLRHVAAICLLLGFGVFFQADHVHDLFTFPDVRRWIGGVVALVVCFGAVTATFLWPTLLYVVGCMTTGVMGGTIAAIAGVMSLVFSFGDPVFFRFGLISVAGALILCGLHFFAERRSWANHGIPYGRRQYVLECAILFLAGRVNQDLPRL